MPLKNSVLEASKLVSTKTLLLKHYYRHQGKTTRKNPPKISVFLSPGVMFFFLSSGCVFRRVGVFSVLTLVS